jgi:hypothetical protein
VSKVKKYLILAIAAILAPVVSMAAGTVTQTIHYDQHDAFGHIVTIKHAILSDASAGTVPDTTIPMQFVDDSSPARRVDLNGFYIYSVETIPGAGADAPTAYTLDITNGEGTSIVDLSARSTSAKEYVNAAGLGFFPAVTGDMTLVVGNLGNANTTEIYVTFVK